MEQRTNNNKAFSFKGTGGEYFSIWIVNIALTIVTFGIYSAWAKVRTKRYFYGNTEYDSANFEYHATPIQILKGKIVAFFAFIIYTVAGQIFPQAAIFFALILGLLAPWAIWQSLKFNARVSSYRNVHFSFQGPMKDMYKILLLIPMIPFLIGGSIAAALYAISNLSGIDVLESDMGTAIMIVLSTTFIAMYFVFPYVQKSFQSYFLNHLYYGQTKFKTEISTKLYYKTYIGVITRTILLMLSFIAIFLLVAGGASEVTRFFENPAFINSLGVILPASILVLYSVVIGFQLWAAAYIQATIRNHIFNNTQLGEQIQMTSKLKITKLMGIYFLNFIQVIFTFGFGYPWAKVRLSQYITESTTANAGLNLHGFINQEQRKGSALGEEIGEIFDMDMDVGF